MKMVVNLIVTGALGTTKKNGRQHQKCQKYEYSDGTKDLFNGDCKDPFLKCLAFELQGRRCLKNFVSNQPKEEATSINCQNLVELITFLMMINGFNLQTDRHDSTMWLSISFKQI